MKTAFTILLCAAIGSSIYVAAVAVWTALMQAIGVAP